MKIVFYNVIVIFNTVSTDELVRCLRSVCLRSRALFAKLCNGWSGSKQALALDARKWSMHDEGGNSDRFEQLLYTIHRKLNL